MVTVYYPTPQFFRSTASTWYEYLLRGFHRAGARVELDEALDAASFSDEAPRPDCGHIWQITALDVDAGAGRRRVYYDWSDFPAVNPELAASGAPYYKIQLRRRDAADNVHPIGQTVSRLEYLEALDGLRTIRDHADYHYDAIGVYRATNYGLRARAVSILKGGPWRACAALAAYRLRPEPPADIIGPLMPFREHLEALARSRLAVCLPGVGGAWTWRHTEALGIGTAVITPAADYATPGPPAAGAWIEADPELGNLAELITHYLANPAERQAIADAGRRYYEAHLSPEAQARQIFETIGAPAA